MAETVYRACTLCEASCGLAFDVEGNDIVGVRGDDEDVFSRGYVCAKGIAIADIHRDPDRLRQPMVRDASGELRTGSWEEALGTAVARLKQVQARHRRDAIAVYFGNPTVHNTGAAMLRSALLRTLGTKNSYSAASQDTSPRLAASWYLYGASFAIPVPDLDRTAYLLCVGANPYVSNGSFLTAPNVRERIRGIRSRGGKVVVVDPRRTETARGADEHVAIRPGGDASLLLAMVRHLVASGRVDRVRLRAVSSGWDDVERLLDPFTADRAGRSAGIAPETIERLAIEFVEAPSAVAYSRIGVCNNRHGTLASFATDLLNLVAGRLGEVGGAMFPSPAIDLVRIVRMVGGDGHARWRTRVRGLPETFGDLPAAALAEEIETPGPGQIRALVTFAGNPVLSVPNGPRLDAALAKLDFVLSIDLYVNETTRHADVILPPAWSLTEEHVSVITANFGVRNVARWSPPVVAAEPGERADWQILYELAERLGGGPNGIPWMDRLVHASRRLGFRWSPGGVLGPFLRVGPYGDRFLPWSRGLNRKRLRAAAHGIDLGAMEPGFSRRVFHRDGKIHLAASPIVEALRDLGADLAREVVNGELLLIGRRQVRTNNSWMHNVPALVSGRERCVLLVNPEDALRAGVRDGTDAILESRVHRGRVRVHVTDEMREGVVSLPHGWGHAASAPWQRTAGAHPGVSANDWTDDELVESVVGQSILNGVPVRLAPLPADELRHAS
ncbi:MAG: hypothetical protein QOD06_2668 [Candidatus Binatota bacterium]|nr:hypothetical protein [Candidatus Binatota bacterium]